PREPITGEYSSKLRPGWPAVFPPSEWEQTNGGVAGGRCQGACPRSSSTQFERDADLQSLLQLNNNKHLRTIEPEGTERTREHPRASARSSSEGAPGPSSLSDPGSGASAQLAGSLIPGERDPLCSLCVRRPAGRLRLPGTSGASTGAGAAGGAACAWGAASMMRKDVNKPKGKTSAYAFFVQTCREEHRKKHPEQSVNFAEFSKKCSERWKGLTANDKKCFEDMAKTDKVRYNREMVDYTPPKGWEEGPQEERPQRPQETPYRPSVKQQFPGLSIGDCAKKLGELWGKQTQSDKLPYEEKAQKLREKYDRDMVAYRGGGTTFSRTPGSSAQAGGGGGGGGGEEDDEGDDDDDEEDEQVRDRQVTVRQTDRQTGERETGYRETDRQVRDRQVTDGQRDRQTGERETGYRETDRQVTDGQTETLKHTHWATECMLCEN
ncbi:hypothetical protein F7725_001398, partial [Dissostichus mawsoni]